MRCDMQRILVLSDSHGRDENVEKAIKQMGRVDMMIHLGDIGWGYERIRYMIPGPVIMVAGNNDFSIDLPQNQIFNIGKHRVFATHGHRQSVHGGTAILESVARQNNCDIAMYGHTHVPYLRRDTDMTVLNPGSISLPRQAGRKKTYMMITMDDAGVLSYKICEL